MKKVYSFLLCFALGAFVHLSAQQATLTPSDSVSRDVAVQSQFDIVDEYIYLHNTHSDSIKINWRLVSADTVPGWSLQLCDNQNCYPLPNTPKTSAWLAPGDSLDFHAILAPAAIAGSGWMKVSVQIAADTFPALIITYHANVTVTSGINSVSAESNAIHVFPNPATDMITIEGLTPSQSSTVQILDVQGRVLSAESRIENPSLNLSISNLPAGSYLVKVLDAEGRLTAVKKFNKL
ncbi:MAG: hypothetical protein JWO06_627 [Bacteroidota bacterium]|nr:hypothetical protein [Bacteroidota bacterium]